MTGINCSQWRSKNYRLIKGRNCDVTIPEIMPIPQKYKLGSMANWPLKLFGGLLVFFSLILSQNNIILAIVCLIVGIAITTSTYGFQIDPENKSYREYMFLMGFKFGKWHSYEFIEKIFINSIIQSERIYSRANQGYTVKKRKLASFLKFTDGRKIRLYEDENRPALMLKLNMVAKDLSTHIEDNTTN